MPLPFLSRFRDPSRRNFARLPSDARTREPLVLDEDTVNRELRRSKIPIIDHRIDLDAFRAWRERADYEGLHPGYYPDNLDEKSLEHFTTADLAELQPGQVVIDIASQSDVVADVFERLHGVEVWQQDLAFPPGVNGRRIGGNAAAIDVADNFADVLTVHCSFEHFEGDADTGFIREVGRILKPGGVCVIAPLYLCQHHACITDPFLDDCAEAQFDSGMRIHILKGWGNRFGRLYSVGKLIERVWDQRGPLEGELRIVDNYRDVAPGVYMRYVLVLRKPSA